MSTAAVEAKSFSALISVAADPPPKPQFVRSEPLVLYIARVPGSRDIFLTPLKPREKVVTAQDVESCLYYIHAHNPENEGILNPPEQWHRPAEEALPPALPLRPRPNGDHVIPTSLRPGPNTTNHHPLPSLPPYPLDDGPPQFMPHSQKNPPVSTVARKPAPSLPSRKLVGEESIQVNGHRHPPLPETPVQPTQEHELSKSEQLAQLTVIRRHPATGDQWNVASIADPSVFEIASDGRQSSMTKTRIRKSGQPLYISIANPGYAKFIHGDEPVFSRSPASNTLSLSYFKTTVNSHQEPMFSRRMWLEGSRFEKKASKHRTSQSADVVESPHLSVRPSFDTRSSSRFSHHTQSHSADGALPWDYNMRRISADGDPKRSNTRGYTFLSPWNGRCEFASGPMGNSLKCRHLRQRNSLAPETDSPTLVSELRFNLPGGGPLASEPQQKPAFKEKESRRSRLLAKLSSDRHSSEDAMPTSSHERRSSHQRDDEKLDLSLGQELAGGGFAGKQAKLGKLIIEGDGLLMMDLLVAANMGLWFRAYEKSI